MVEEGSRFWTPSSSLYGAYSWPTLVNHPLWREEAEAPEGAKTSPGSCGEQIGWAGSGGRKGLGCLQLSPLFPSRVFVQIPFCLGLGHGRLAWQGSWTSHLFEPRLSYLWKQGCPESFLHYPTQGYEPRPGPGHPAGPLRKKPGLWLWVGPVASSRSPTSGSHQARGGGSCKRGLGRGTCLFRATHRPTPWEQWLWAHGPTGLAAVSASRQRLLACSLTPFRWLPSLSPHWLLLLLLLQNAIT